MKSKGRGLVWAIGMLICSFMAGCFEEEQYYFGTCAEDSDLRTPNNFYEGAICVDGQAQCPDGQPFCQRIAIFEDHDRLISTCTGPCITCPDHQGACIGYNRAGENLSHMCADSFVDCWNNYYFIPLDSATKRCPKMSLDCW